MNKKMHSTTGKEIHPIVVHSLCDVLERRVNPTREKYHILCFSYKL